MNILFLEGENPIANFIERRINKLSEDKSLKIFIHVHLSQRINCTAGNVTYLYKINLKQDFNLSMRRLLVTFPSFFFRMKKIYRYAPHDFNILKKINWSLYYNEIVVDQIDIIHLQYIGQFSLVGWTKMLYKSLFISSVRGAQVTHMADTIPGYINTITNAFSGSDFIHCVSNSLKERCIFLGADPSKVFVNYNGINLRKYLPNTGVSAQQDVLKLITVSSLTWRKGIIYQLLALKKIKEILPGANVELLIIGEGPENIQIQYTSQKMGLAPNVKLLGKKNEPEIVELLQNAHIYLTTSAAEGLSNSVMEGLSCGLPVIAFDCEGAAELINHGETGFIVEYGNVDKYAKCLQLLITDNQLLKKMSVNARRKMEKEFDIETHATKMINFYKHKGIQFQ